MGGHALVRTSDAPGGTTPETVSTDGMTDFDGGSDSDPAAGALPADVTPSSLHRDHFDSLVRVAALMVDDWFAAEEIAQDAFAQLVARWRQIDPDRAVGYLYRAVTNGARSALRRRRTTRAHTPEPPGTAPGSDAAALRADGYQRLLNAVATLPPRQRQVLVLRYYAEQSIAECAAALSISETAVTAATHRAITTLAGRRDELA